MVVTVSPCCRFAGGSSWAPTSIARRRGTMRVMYSSLLRDKLIIVGQTSTLVCVCDRIFKWSLLWSQSLGCRILYRITSFIPPPPHCRTGDRSCQRFSQKMVLGSSMISFQEFTVLTCHHLRSIAHWDAQLETSNCPIFAYLTSHSFWRPQPRPSDSHEVKQCRHSCVRLDNGLVDER